MKNEELGNQFMALIAQAMGGNAETLEGKIQEMVKEAVSKMGTGTVTHEVKVGTYEPKKIKGLVSQEFDEVLAWVVNFNAVMLTGPAGTGKGTMARQVAEALEADFFEVNAVQNAYELTGFVDANSYYVETPFYRACKNAADGNPTVFLFDEIDCSVPEVLKIFNEALSSYEFTFPNGELLEFPEMRIICAANTYGTGADMQYCGNQLDASTLDRFAMIEVGYDPKIDLAVANGDGELVEFIHKVRTVTETMKIIVSYRSIKRIASMKGVADMRCVLRQGLFKGVSEDDMEIIKNCLKTSTPNNPYTRALLGEDVQFKAKKTA